MPHGNLSPAQQEAVHPYIQGKVVHDLGCGDGELSLWLVKAGAEKVIGLDRDRYVFNKLSKVVFVHGHFHDYHEPCETAFVSWPVNWQSGIESILARAKTVVYLGTNMGGSSCGSREMFEHLVGREVLAHLPEQKNTLIVYGPRVIQREPLPEEFAALNQEKMYSFRELYEVPIATTG